MKELKGFYPLALIGNLCNLDVRGGPGYTFVACRLS